MTSDKKTSATIPFALAIACGLILLLVISMSILSGNSSTTQSGTVSGNTKASIAIPSACPAVFHPVPSGPAVPVILPYATLSLTRPDSTDRIVYTQRGFSGPVEASIAWWMSPGFMDNTTEFRGYERKTPEGKAQYPEEHRIFFNFIEENLDTAEQLSALHNDTVLFRGINPTVSGIVMNNSEYREPAFASTSYDISFSLDAFGTRSPDGYRNVLILTRHSGDHTLYINEDEREFLLPRNSDWYVVRSVNVGNLIVTADFPLHGRNVTAASFDHVRLIYIDEISCT